MTSEKEKRGEDPKQGLKKVGCLEKPATKEQILNNLLDNEPSL